MSDNKAKVRYQKCSEKELIRQFQDQMEFNDEEAFCFLLGAGASKSSRIRTGGEMAYQWFQEIYEYEDGPSWLAENNITEDNCADYYSELFGRRFKPQPKNGIGFLRKEMDGKDPNIGYIILAQILSKGVHNLVVTTNFDRLIEDALSYYPSESPLIIGHESLSSYVQLEDKRPMLLKVHHDLLLGPKNHQHEINKMPTAWERLLKNVVKKRRLLVVGYGGNDGSVMNLLKEIPTEERMPIHWCIRKGEQPNAKMLALLEEKDFLIEISGFDELMLHLGSTYEIKIPEKLDHIEDDLIVIQAKDRVNKLIARQAELKAQLANSKDANAVDALDKFFGDNWWSVEQKVDETDDIEEKDRLYQRGMQEFPESHELIGNYALFLKNICKNYKQAESYFKKALELEPDHANNVGNYATFLHTIRKNYDLAENYYQKALELNPEHANCNGNYALFLTDILKEHEQAEKHYKKALKLDPNSIQKNANYAKFLRDIRQDYKQAEVHFKKSLKLAPEHASYNANYAEFLLTHGRVEEGEQQLNKTMTLAKAQNVQKVILVSWFYRLAHFPKRAEEAREHIQKLLNEDITATDWNLQFTINRAEKDGTADIKELKELAEKITGKPH